jgi:hypothetical protein
MREGSSLSISIRNKNVLNDGDVHREQPQEMVVVVDIGESLGLRNTQASANRSNNVRRRPQELTEVVESKE